MRNFFKWFGIYVSVIVVSAVTLFVLYNYVPASWFDIGKTHDPQLGSTITTINGTDTLSNSRTTINTNFSNLNSTKLENTATTFASLTSAPALATVGTIVSGTWNASTLTVPYGGTASTTISANQVLLGNGTSAIKVVSGLGVSGQSLVSNGPGLAPTWQSVSFDTTANYNNTGNWNFTGNTYIKKLNASSTSANPITLNGLPFDTSSTRGASSTVLTEDGNGHLSFQLATSTYKVGLMTATSTTGGAASGNEDSVQTVGFAPMFIRLNYYVQGHTNSGGTNVYTGMRGTALFLGTTLINNNIEWQNTGGLTGGDNGAPILNDFNNTNAAFDGAVPVSSGTGNNSGWITSALSISSITSTGFTIRCAFSGNGGNTGRCNASWEAWR